MAMDLMQFDKTEFVERTSEVRVAELAAFFPEGEPPVWVVRGMTGEQIAATRLAADRNRMARNELTNATTNGANDEAIQAMRVLLGITLDGALSDEHVQHLNTVVYGSVSPKVSLEHVVKLARVHPIVFTTLYNEIYRLTGLGHEPKKP